jgi:hypothetical protein
MEAKLKALVQRCAGFRCESCKFPERFAGLRFQKDHIIAKKSPIETREGQIIGTNLRVSRGTGFNPRLHEPNVIRIVANAWPGAEAPDFLGRCRRKMRPKIVPKPLF